MLEVRLLSVEKDYRTLTVTVPVAPRDRMVILAWSKNAAAELLPPLVPATDQPRG